MPLPAKSKPAPKSKTSSKGKSSVKKSVSKQKSDAKSKLSARSKEKSNRNIEVASKFVKELNLSKKYTDIENLNLIQEEVADDYMVKSKLENFLVLAIRETIRGDILPKNPFPKILRSLRQSLWYNTSNSDMKARSVKFVKNYIKEITGEFNITTTKKETSIFGYRYILEKLNVNNVKFIQQFMSELLLPIDTVDGKHESRVYYSLGGSYIFESYILPYSLSYSRHIEIHGHHFVDGPTLKKALEMHVQYIYDDIRKFTSSQSKNLFLRLHVDSDDNGKNSTLSWGLEDVVNQKTLFLTQIDSSIKQRKRIVLKFLYRTEIPREDYYKDKNKKPHESVFNIRYYEIWRYYHFHFTHTENDAQTQSFSYFPLSALLRGVFLSERASQFYAGFYYEDGQIFTNSDYYKKFLYEQVYSLKKNWESQSISCILWECFFLIQLQETNVEQERYLYEIQRILSIIPASLLCISKMFNKSKKLMNAFIITGMECFKEGALGEIRAIIPQLQDLLENSNYPESHYFKDVILRCTNTINGLVSNLYCEASEIQLASRSAASIFKIVDVKSKIFSNSDFLDDFITDSLEAHGLFDEVMQPLTYLSLDNERIPSEVLDMTKARTNFKDILKFKSKISEDEADDFIILAYLEKTGVYQRLRDILYDVYYGQKFPNPLPRICTKIENFSFKEQQDNLLLSDIEETIYREDQTVTNAYFGNLEVKHYFSCSNLDAEENDLPTLYGVLPLAKICPVHNFESIFDNIAKLNWRTLCTDNKLDDGVRDFMSLSVFSIFQIPELFEIECSVNNLQHDFYFETASINDALLNLINVIFEFLLVLDKSFQSLKIVPLGFYYEENMEAIVTMRDITDQLFSASSLKEMLMENLEKGKAICLKMVTVQEDGSDISFRLFKIDLNVFMIEGENIYSVKKQLTISDFLRFFLSAEDCSYYNNFIPYNKLQVLTQIADEKKRLQSEGLYVQAALHDVYFNLLDEKRPRVSNLYGVLATKVLFIYYLSQKYDLLYQLTYILEYGGDTDSESWASISSVKVELYFDKFFDELVTTTEYENVCLDGVLSRIMNLHRYVSKLFKDISFDGTQYEKISEKTKWKKIRLIVEKIKSLLEALCTRYSNLS